MGPVSFVSIEVGTSREEVMAAAAKLADADLRVMSTRSEETTSGQRWFVVVASHDAVRARHLLSS